MGEPSQNYGVNEKVSTVWPLGAPTEMHLQITVENGKNGDSDVSTVRLCSSFQQLSARIPILLQVVANAAETFIEVWSHLGPLTFTDINFYLYRIAQPQLCYVGSWKCNSQYFRT